jgi:glycogen operon protein
VIYEMHVGGFSRHGSARALHPGTFEAMIAKIPYLVDLGITTVELMPIFSFDADAPDRVDPLSGRRLRDFWGYNPLGFFAPHADYLETDGRDPTPLARLQELVKALHAADLEVFLDVVFNHTGEGDHRGPMHSLRGIDNPTYYIVKRDGSGEYQDFSGCGNTVNCNHPGVRRMILDSLRYWTKHFKIDGFRFDLAAVLSRDEDGRPLEEPPLIWEIEGDPELERTTLIAEAWDAAGLYQVGRFPGERWCEWNGRFRDDVRRFWRGDQGLIGALAQRLLGSPDLYEAQGRSPSQGVNFITCHDGFTLHDLVSYATRHNHANGEQNRDGAGEEFSSNHGVEGPTRDPETIALRARQTRNLLTTLLVSQGTPMLLAGDEFGRTQRGNNNPWCQDNEVSWIDWGLLEENASLHRFVRTLLRFRRSHHSLHRSEFLLGFDAPVGHDTPGYTRVRWHGIEPGQANWDDNNRLLCMMLTPASDDVAIHVILNAGLQPVTVRLSTPPSGHRWLRVIDTSLASPDDIREPNDEVPVLSANYRVESRSSVVLIDESPPPARGHATQRIVLPESLR